MVVLMLPGMIIPCGANTGIFQNYINVIAEDALAPCIARSSTIMIVTMQDKRVSSQFLDTILPA